MIFSYSLIGFMKDTRPKLSWNYLLTNTILQEKNSLIFNLYLLGIEKGNSCNVLTTSAQVAPVTCVQTRSGKFNLPGDPFNKVQGLWEDCNGVKTDDSKVWKETMDSVT